MAAKIAGMAVPQMQRRAEAVMEKVVNLCMITNNICGVGPLIENNCPTKLPGAVYFKYVKAVLQYFNDFPG
jgi:hypothetical protein